MGVSTGHGFSGEATTAESEGQLVSNETSEVNTERMA
jgi:hypothetical protein